MYTTTVDDATGVTALAKLILFGRDASVFSTEEKLIVDGEQPLRRKERNQAVTVVGEEDEVLKGYLSKPNRVRKLKNTIKMIGGKLKFKIKK